MFEGFVLPSCLRCCSSPKRTSANKMEEDKDMQEDASDEENNDQDMEDDVQEDTTPPSNQTQEKKLIKLGGSGCTDGKPAYALLTGIWTDNDDDSIKKGEEIVVDFPIMSLPIVLGRKWGSTAKDPHHVSLPRDEKLLSRQHACIFFRDEKGGKLGCYEIVSGESGSAATEKIIYKPYEADVGEEGSTFDPNSIYRLPGMKQTDPLPKSGFFAIECLGRHTIKVGDKKVTKGNQAMLRDGIPIQIASYCFYFLLPKDAPPISQSFQYQVKNVQPKKEATSETTSSKPKISDETKPTEKIEVKEPPAKKPKKTDDSYMTRLDKVSTQELLSQLTAASESEEWSKDDQLCSATLGMRIAREAAKDGNIQKIARTQHGVTQRDIIDWYKNHALYSDFERLMRSKIEYKSYQSSITKAIQRAGFTRNESNPGKTRFTRWDLPADVELVPIPASPPRSPRAQIKTSKKSTESKPSEKAPLSKSPPSVPKLIPRDVMKTPTLNEVLMKETGKTLENKEVDSPSDIKSSTTVDTEDIPLSELEKAQPPPKL